MREYQQYSKEEVLLSRSGVFTVDWDNTVKSTLYPETNIFKTLKAAFIAGALAIDTNARGLLRVPKLKRSFKIRVSWEEKVKEDKRFLEISTFLRSSGVNGKQMISMIIPKLIELCEAMDFDEIQTMSLLPRRYMIKNGWTLVYKVGKKYGRYSIKVDKLKEMI